MKTRSHILRFTALSLLGATWVAGMAQAQVGSVASGGGSTTPYTNPYAGNTTGTTTGTNSNYGGATIGNGGNQSAPGSLGGVSQPNTATGAGTNINSTASPEITNGSNPTISSSPSVNGQVNQGQINTGTGTTVSGGAAGSTAAGTAGGARAGGTGGVGVGHR